MLIVNVDLVPFGRAAQTKTIARIAIANDGPKDLNKEYYCYHAWISKEDPVGDKLGLSTVQLDTSVKPDVYVVHRRERGAIALLHRVLEEYDEYAHLHQEAIAEDEEKKARKEAYNEDL